MKHLKSEKNAVFQISLQQIAILAITAIAAPLFLSVLIFCLYTLQTNRKQMINAQLSTLDIYRLQLEDTLQTAEDYLSDIVLNDSDYQMFLYSNTKMEAYLAAKTITDKYKSLMQMQEMLSALCIYSEDFDCFRLVYEPSYPVRDLVALRKAVCAAVRNTEEAKRWIPLSFSDRTVLFCFYPYHGTVFAAMVDPSRQVHSLPEEDSRIFYLHADGTPFAPSAAFDRFSVPVPQNTETACLKTDGVRYNLVSLPLLKTDGFILYASPVVSLSDQLNTVQKVLLLVTLCLLLFIPGSWLLLHRILLIPVDRLSKTMNAIEQGDQSIRMQQDSRISEVNEISCAVNNMMDTICRQKIDAYEQQLETQHAQLQYLQLQIRPHFFLNCLNLIYSMAEEGKVGDLQELTLDLSTYLRSIFKDSRKLIPLSTELSSVESYLRIQQAGVLYPPQLDLVCDAAASNISVPPLCILTFVENAVKHSKLADKPLCIRIRCFHLSNTDGEYLNVTVQDNGGGISPEQLAALNHADERLYTDLHVGISNIRHRLRLLYADRASFSFRNVTNGVCVDLFLPVETVKWRFGI